MKTNMGNTGSKKVAEMDELIRTQAEAGNRFAQLDLGMLYLSNGKVSSEHEKASLMGNIVFINCPATYLISLSAVQNVPRAIHVLGVLAYRHYRYHNQFYGKSDDEHDYFLKASLKLCNAAAAHQNNKIFSKNEDLQHYAVNTDSSTKILDLIRKSMFDRFVITHLDMSDIKGETIVEMASRCNTDKCACIHTLDYYTMEI